MTLADLQATLATVEPPKGVGLLIEALWWDAKGDWSRAHQIAQDVSSPDASWVHAYLHRKEGDASNADYWYRRAGKSPTQQTLETEWRDIVEEMLAAHAS